MRKYSVTKRVLKLYCSYHPAFLPLRMLQSVLEAFTPYFNLWISAEIVSALYEGRQSREVYLLVAAALFGNLIAETLKAVVRRAAETALKTLRNNEAAFFYRKTLSLDYDKMENPAIRQLRRKILENSWINGYGVNKMEWELVSLMDSSANLIFSAFLLVEMISLMMRSPRSWPVVLLFLGMFGCMVLGVLRQRVSAKKRSEYWDRVGDLMLKENRIARGFRLNGMDCRIYRQQPILNRMDMKMNKEHLEVFSYAGMMSYLQELPQYFLSKLSSLCTYLIICLYCLMDVFPMGSVIKYVGYLGRVTGYLDTLFSSLNELAGNEKFLETYLEYLNLENDMYQGSLAVEKRSDKKFDISFKDVSFRYSGSDKEALKHVSLDLKVGERLAVVGQNGSGKTTFIKLLCRLYDPTQGEIIMNDFNIRKYDYRQYLNLFSVVFQDYHLLALPLGNNVSSAQEWDAVKAKRLLEETGFGERYREMPKGLETPLYKNFDEDGVMLSGGEAQKVALARALYRDAPFIILDEPTAALDPVAEAEIYARFDEIVGDKTTIYISHRLSSCRFCDKIAVFDNGEIVQLGTHEELLADAGGKYYELWHAQAQYYNERKSFYEQNDAAM